MIGCLTGNGTPPLHSGNYSYRAAGLERVPLPPDLRPDPGLAEQPWEGAPISFADGALTATPLATNASDIPIKWRVQLPAKGLDVTVQAINNDAWMTTTVPYWEGPVTVSGSHTGRGYLEMTGYE